MDEIPLLPKMFSVDEEPLDQLLPQNQEDIDDYRCTLTIEVGVLAELDLQQDSCYRREPSILWSVHYR